MESVYLLKPGHNCWRRSEAEFAALVIDYANYYRALHNAICKARHSIFIVGWDIDSRIRLLRGQEERRSPWPSVISELIARKARENPLLKVYLLRWDSSLAFFSKRELLLKEVWDQKTPANVQTCLDASIPMGGSQHQKVVVIDDEIAFTGGMDVAVQRWDTRKHRVVELEREDENGIYTPLHDVQSVVAGPVVAHFAELVRWRWSRVADSGSPPPLRDLQRHNLEVPPPAWPDGVEPLFRNIPCAIARTIPFMDNATPVQEVRQMFLDLIATATDFIYLENQFVSREEIAEALNRRLKACKTLQVLVISSYRPKTAVECEAYWASRIDFKNILEEGVEQHRVKMLYSFTHDEEGNFGHKRIHSKVTTIDDRYLVVGSANLSNRSMALDTECDLIFAANNEAHKQQILKARNDLVGEHCGRSEQAVSRILSEEKGLELLLKPAGKYSYRLKEVQDDLFTDKALQGFVQPFLDPEQPVFPPFHTLNGQRFSPGNPSRKLVMISALMGLVVFILGIVYGASYYFPDFSSESVRGFLEQSRGTWWGLPAVCLVYVIGGIIFFPVTVLSLAVAAVFGPVWGPIYGMCGAILSAALLFGIGHLLGVNGLRKLWGAKVRTIDEKFRRSGVIGVAAVRLVPIAPYSLVNLVAGISSISLFQFLAGTFVGMLPPMVAKGLVGDSLVQVFVDPSPLNVVYFIAGIAGWVGVVILSHKLVNYYQQQKAA